MHVPVIASLRETVNNVNANANADGPRAETPEATAIERRPGRFGKYGRPSAFRHQYFDASRAALAEAEAEDFGLEERARTCPRGKAFYRCANRFTGCCSHDPCDVSELMSKVFTQSMWLARGSASNTFCIHFPLCLRHLLTLFVPAWRIMSRR